MFLILLGRGRVIGPVKQIEALVDFVRTRLLLERVRERNGLIERDLENWFGGLRVITGSPGDSATHSAADRRAVRGRAGPGVGRPEVHGRPAGLPDSVATATDGSEAVDRIDRATRFHYVLGYDSSNTTLDGRQRGIGKLRQTTTRVPFDGEALYLKVIAYDYGSDLVGTATRALR